MKNIYTFLLILAIASLANSQSISLVQDVNPGTAGSVRGSSTVFNGSIYYVGFVAGQFGNQIIRYDRTTGSAAAITSAFNSFDILLAATDQYLYVTDDDVLYRMDPVSGGLTELFTNPTGREIESLVTDGDLLVISTSFSFSNLGVYAIKDDQSTVTELDAGNFNDEVEVTINDEFIALREKPDFGFSGSFQDLLVDRVTLVAATEEELASILFCGDTYNLAVFDDYIIYGCNDGEATTYFRDMATGMEFIIDGSVEDVRVGKDYIFLDIDFDLYSMDKTTGELIMIVSFIETIGNLNEEGTVLYFLKEFDDEILATDGSSPNESSFEFGESTLSYEINDVFAFGSRDVLLLDDGNDRFIKIIEGDAISDLNDLGEIDINSTDMPFYKFGNELVFSFDDDTYGPELFIADFMPTSTVEDQLESVQVTPNPVSDLLQLELEQNIAVIEIYDNRGILVKRLRNAQNNINVSNFPPGLYTLRVLDVHSKVYQSRFAKI